jgi:hypothetical protein
MAHRRRPTPTRRLILELRTISSAYRSSKARELAAAMATAIPQTKAEATATRMGDIAKSARGLLRRFGDETDLDTLRTMAREAADIAAALDTAPGTTWQTQTYTPTARAAA